MSNGASTVLRVRCAPARLFGPERPRSPSARLQIAVPLSALTSTSSREGFGGNWPESRLDRRDRQLSKDDVNLRCGQRWLEFKPPRQNRHQGPDHELNRRTARNFRLG